MEVVLIAGAAKGAKLQSNRHRQQTETLYRPDALPVADNAVRCNYCFCYLSVQRFREYQTRSNLMVRLQAKYNCIEKALKGVSCPAFSSRCECLSIVVAK